VEEEKWVGVRLARRAMVTAGRPAGGAVGGTAVHVRQHIDHCSEHAQAQGQEFDVGGTAAQGERFREAGHVGAVGSNFPGNEGPRHRLGPGEDGMHEEADGEGTAGGAVGDERQGEQRRSNARKQPPVPECSFHVGSSPLSATIL